MQQKYKITENTFEKDASINDFACSVIDLFTDKKSGNLAHFLYSHSLSPVDKVRGSRLAAELYYNSEVYYPFHYESALLRDSSRAIAESIPLNSTLIELGPGPQQAVRNKTIPLLKTMKKISSYCAIDLCSTYLEEATSTILSYLPITMISILQGSFYDDAIIGKAKSNGHNTLIMLGNTIGNIREKDGATFPENTLEKMKFFNALMNPGDIFIFGYDTNQNVKKMRTAYDNNLSAAFTLNILERIKRDIPGSSLNTNNFKYLMRWQPNSHCLKRCIQSTKAQTITIQNIPIQIPKDKVFCISESYKFTNDTISSLAHLAGFDTLKLFTDSENMAAIHLLQKPKINRPANKIYAPTTDRIAHLSVKDFVKTFDGN